jgi:hypothetical protein
MTTEQQKTAKTPLEMKREELAAKRDANRKVAEAMAEAREQAMIDDEVAYEEARASAYADPKLGPERVTGGLVKGAGFVLLRWPDAVTWRHFQNLGILKKDGMKQELCEDLLCRSVVYPDLPKFRQILERNPSASVQLTTMIIDQMHSEAFALGNEQTSSLPKH